MATAPVGVGQRGPKGINFRNAWSSTSVYAAHDAVTDAGSVYLCRLPNTGLRPSTSPAEWELFLPGGAGATGTVLTIDGVAPDDAGNVDLSDSYWPQTVPLALDADLDTEAGLRAAGDALLVPLALIGVGNGICPLGADGNVDASFLPPGLGADGPGVDSVDGFTGAVVLAGRYYPTTTDLATQAELDGEATRAEAAETVISLALDDEIAQRKVTALVVLRFRLDGTPGSKDWVSVPFDGTIVKRRLSADAVGDATVDVWRDTWSNFPPTIADTITASAKAALAGSVKTEDATLTGWSKNLSAGDVLMAKVDAASGVTRLVLELFIQPTS
jgi:hypothetical protein